MQFLIDILPWVQVILAVILTVSILLQQSGAGIGGAFGGSDETVNYTRRGFEKFLFQATIVTAILFTISVFLSLFA